MIVEVRVNGRGNAWPIEVGARENKRDDERRHKPLEYANTSLSIIGVGAAEPSTPRWEVVFDIGQGVFPILTQNGTRLPNALIVSHPHFDHIAGLDWLVSSHGRNSTSGTRLPVYTSRPCWDEALRRFGYLQGGMNFRELRPGQFTEIEEAPGLWVKPFPVFHGDYAPGACMVLVEYRPETGPPVRAILTGDLLCPLLRKADWDTLRDVEVVYADANTRFPCPRSGHWSLTGRDAAGTGQARALTDWVKASHPTYLISPHSTAHDPVTYAFLDALLAESRSSHDLCWDVCDFVKRVQPQNVQLVHYSGFEDFKEYQQEIYTDDQLAKWVKEIADANAITASWKVPKPGETFTLYP